MSTIDTSFGAITTKDPEFTLTALGPQEESVDTNIANGRYKTLEQVAELFGVSTRTLGRWRKLSDHPLESGVIVQGRKQVVCTLAQITAFRDRHPEVVRRAAKFRQYSPQEKMAWIAQLQQMSAEGCSLANAVKALVQEHGVAPETIHPLVRRYNEEHPDAMLFSVPDDTRLFNENLAGESIASIARRLDKPRTHIGRLIQSGRAKHIRGIQEKLDYMDNGCFSKKDAEKKILGTEPPQSTEKPRRAPAGIPPYLASLYEVPLLTREQEQYLFRRMNFQLYRAANICPDEATAKDFRKMQGWMADAEAIRNRIMEANLRLVVSIVKKSYKNDDQFLEDISEQNMTLLRAIRKFDYGRGNKFSTYASWAIMKDMIRAHNNGQRLNGRFMTGHEESFLEGVSDKRTSEVEEESKHGQRQELVGKLLSNLDPREIILIGSRFGLRKDEEPKTLKEVGVIMGVTKERVRQIEVRAMRKLREAAEERKIPIDEILQSSQT
ncbi:sigma-70 family RNA polymerase sigma factor [Patescibacteria group bacterium]|nr:sigma-70 family RNA polymerase sigma factor [Patescibacteria group bacterium]